ncbi:MAG: glutaredoxin family protein [Myxococcaceae bacterium]
MRVEIYSKPDCGLCEEAKEILEQVRSRVPFELVEVNIEADPTLFERFRYDIPVVFIAGKKAFKHRVEAEAVLRRLCRQPGMQVAQPEDTGE